MTDAVGLHDLVKLRGGANLRTGRFVFDVRAVGKPDRIDHMGVAVYLWLFKNTHRTPVTYGLWRSDGNNVNLDFKFVGARTDKYAVDQRNIRKIPSYSKNNMIVRSFYRICGIEAYPSDRGTAPNRYPRMRGISPLKAFFARRRNR